MIDASTQSARLLNWSREGVWWAVQSKPRQELRAQASLQAGGILTLLPLVRRATRARAGGVGTAGVRVEPLFPRYLFARCDSLTTARHIRFARGVARIVGTDDGPLPVDEAIIQSIEQRVAADGFVHLAPALRPGDRVRVVAGPLEGFVGVFDASVGGPDRVRLLLAALHGDCRILVDETLVEPVRQHV